MAEVIREDVIIKPVEPIEPTYCPTCFSGLQPVDPPYEDAIDPKSVAY